MEIRRGERSKAEFLDELFNKFGDSELSIAYSYETNGEIGFSKWIKWEVLMNLNDDDKVPEINLTKAQFVKRATHRSVLDIEILFDVDDDLMDKKGLNKWVYPSILDKAKHIFDCLKNEGKNPVMCSANRGYHISVVVPGLRDNMSYEERRDFKTKILTYYDCDVQKANRCLISMEGEKHWKSGKIKTEVL